MDLSLDEQRLIAEFRKLSAAGKEELLVNAASLARKAGDCADNNESSQCKIKHSEEHPEAEKTPFFTE